MSDGPAGRVASGGTPWHRGKAIWSGRSCGDCSFGPPCRCHSGNWWEMLSAEQRADVLAFMPTHPDRRGGDV